METEIEKRPRVTYCDAYKVGGCQGCGDCYGMVFEINANNWITRFCRRCLDDIAEQTKRLK